MTKDDMEIVSAMSAQLVDRVGRQRYDLWFGGKTRLVLRGDTLTLEASSPFIQDWLRKNFRTDLEAICREAQPAPLQLDYRVNPELAAASAEPAAPSRAAAKACPVVNAERSPLASSLPPQGVAPKRAGFEDFVVGATNRLAFTSAQLAAERPGSVSPLVVHGPTGCGKTHLLHAVRAAAQQANHKVHAVYMTAEQFTTLFLEALSGQGLPNFRRKYRGVDLLMIDDVQFFAGKRATLVELLYTIDTLLEQGKQLVLSADRSPGELTSLGPELTARLAGGLVCRIDAPEFETRRGIVEVLSRRMGLEVPAEVQALVATHATTHARELAGALRRLQATSLAQGQPITRTLAETALADMASQSGRVVRLPDIERAVCDVFGLEPSSLQSDRKAKSVSYPRMLAMFLARKHTRAALSEIGHFFGRRSHSTVISANKNVTRWMSQHQSLQLCEQTLDVEEALRRVEQKLKAS